MSLSGQTWLIVWCCGQISMHILALMSVGDPYKTPPDALRRGFTEKYPRIICLDFYEARIVFRLKSLLLFSIAIDMIDMKRIVAISCLLVLCFCGAYAQTGVWSGKISVQGTDLPLVFHIGDDSATMDSPAQGVRGIPAEANISEIGKLTIKVPSIGAIFDGLYLGRQIVGTFTQNGVSFPLTLTPGEPKLNRPQTPIGPFPYTQEDVSFANGDAVLKGTLVLPEGYSRKTPVLVMVTGSGLQNRDEEIFEHKPFAVIADALARKGVATLRYDDRGFGESTGDAVNCTTEDLKNDALSGINFLRKRFDKVGVIGHSEGGTIAFMLAAEGNADFIISLAGMIVSGKELLLWQNRTILAYAGFGSGAVDEYYTLLKRAFDARISDGPMPSAEGTGLPDALKQNFQAVLMQLQSPYMKYFLELDVRKLLNKVHCPVLALNGTKDTQVECRSNLEALKAGLPAGGNNCIEAVDGVNHMFQHCATGVSTEYRGIEETFSPEVLQKIIIWIESL